CASAKRRCRGANGVRRTRECGDERPGPRRRHLQPVIIGVLRDLLHQGISSLQTMESVGALSLRPRVSSRKVSIMLQNIEYLREAPVWSPSTIADATKEWFDYLSPTADARVRKGAS